MRLAGKSGRNAVDQASVLIRRLGGRRFAGALLSDSIGNGVVMPLAILFFTFHKGMPATTVGLGLTIGGLVSMVLSPLGGHLIDELSPKRALLVSWMISALAAGSWVLVHNLWELALVQAVGNCAGGMGWNATQALLGAISSDEEMSQVMATSYTLHNLGFGVGGLLSALALTVGGIGFDIAVYVNAASFLVAVLLAVGFRMPDVRPRTEPDDDITIWTVLADKRYVGLMLLHTMMSFTQVGLSVILPLWVVLETHAPKELVGLMYTLNTLIVVVGQLRVSADVREPQDTPRAYTRVALTMIGASGAYLLAHYLGELPAILLVIVGTTLLTFSEMFTSASAFVVSMRFAHEQHRGKYLSVFGMGWSLENAAGPTVGTALVTTGVVFPWPAMGVIVTAGALGARELIRRTTSASGA